MINTKAFNKIEITINNLNSLIEANLELLSLDVNNIISSNSKNENYIESLLDRLLDLYFNENILILYKKLCRYYFDINPEATKDYVMYYFKRSNEDTNKICSLEGDFK